MHSVMIKVIVTGARILALLLGDLGPQSPNLHHSCLLYTSDAADDVSWV